MDLAKMLRMIRAYRAGGSLGDALVLKVDALSKAPPGMNERLAALAGDVPRQSLATLRALPPSTFGREYARFLDANGIVPLAVSAAVQVRFRAEPWALRYATTHDIHHALTGFDAGLAGEIGVLAFTVGQGSAPTSRAMLWVACILYSLIAPTQTRRIWHNARVGLAMGKAAALVIGCPVESYFEEPLEAVRSKLGIIDPRAAGILPSGTSLVGKLVVRAT